MNGSNEAKDVDEGLYSRQLYVYGHEAQRKLQSTNILIVGMKGLGVEIAKNIILAGVKSVHILDDCKTEIGDLSAQFYLTPANVGQPRAASCLKQLIELNPYVSVHLMTGPVMHVLAQVHYDVVVVTEETVSNQIQINNYCHPRGIKFVSGAASGLFATVFVDICDSHVVSDVDGEQPKRGLLANVSSANPGIVLCGDDKLHGLSDGDFVTFSEVSGMVELNDSVARPIRVVSPIAFSIENCTGYTPYSGTKGYFIQVKQSKTISSRTLEATLNCPSIEADYGTKLALHALHLSVSQFRDAHSRYPSVSSLEEASEVVAGVDAILGRMDVKVDFDAKIFSRLARIAGCELAPMTAFVGGILGQEVLKACTGKFMPLQQYFYFDAIDCLPDQPETDLSTYAPQNNRYDSQIAVFGIIHI